MGEFGAEVLAAEDVEVEVRDFAVGVGAIVDDNPVAGFVDAGGFGDVGHGEEQLAECGGIRFGGGAQPCDVRFGDEHDVDAGVGGDIVEGEDVVVLEDDLCRDFLAEDFAEDGGVLHGGRIARNWG